MDIKSKLESLLIIAREAGKAAMVIYDKDFNIEYKGDNSPVTDADLAAHKVIVKGLAKLTPDVPILSEENSDISWSERQTWHEYWLVDPIDGTKEFIKKNGEFTVNIALIQNGKPVMAVVDAPALGFSYLAEKTLGSFKDDGKTRSQLQVKLKPATGTIRVVGSRSHPSAELAEYVKQFDSVDMVSKGSSLKLCLVAENAADIYPRLGLTSEWDTGAGHAIAEIAGAHITQLNGSPLIYNTKESYLNPFFIVSALEL